MSTHPPEKELLLAFGAHPDDIEFGCGGVIAAEAQAGRPAHLVVGSRGESGTNGTPAERVAEAEKATERLGASLEFIPLGHDAHFEYNVKYCLELAAVIRIRRPAVVLAPSLVENQHPDHWKLGKMVRDACRLARFGGVDELRSLPPHGARALYYYAVTVEAEPRDTLPILFDVSAPEAVANWKAAMEAHASQQKTRNYAEMQLMRARLNGARCQSEYAIPLFPNDPVVVDALGPIARTARRF